MASVFLVTIFLIVAPLRSNIFTLKITYGILSIARRTDNVYCNLGRLLFNNPEHLRN